MMWIPQESIAGECFDFANGAWYTIEGDAENAAISFASTIPLVYATTVKNVGRLVKMGDGSYQVLKVSQQQSTVFLDKVKSLNLDDDALRRFNLDLNDGAFAEAIAGNPDLVDSWKVLSNGKASLRNIDNINAVDAFKKANPNITDDAIQSAFDGLKASRKQSFVDALGSCADNKNLIGSLKKSKLASVEEIKGALNKMRDYKTGKPQAGNLGYLEGNVSGATIDGDKFWKSVSIAEARKETHIFDAIDATGSSGTWKRITDSEYRMLNDLAKRLGGVKGQVKESITGSLKIVSENPYCASCQGVIQQFSDMFPNVEITLIDGVK